MFKSKIKLLTIIVVFLQIFTLFAHAYPKRNDKSSSKNTEQRMRIAVLDLAYQGISRSTGNTISNLIRTEFINLRKYLVIERSQMNKIFTELELQESGCTDNECAIKIGKLLSTKKIIIGEASKLDTLIIINLRLVDVESGISEYAANERVENINNIETSINILVRKLSAQIEGDETEDEVSYTWETEEKGIEEKDTLTTKKRKRSLSPGIVMLGLMPGVAQYYTGSAFKGTLFLGTFITSGIYWFYRDKQYKDIRDKYDKLDSDSSADSFSDKYKESDDAASKARTASIIFFIVYGLNMIDVLLFTDHRQNEASINEAVFFNNRKKNSATDFNISFIPGIRKENQLDISIIKRF